jgi:cell cycle checkpoint control protein RAD9A
MEAILDVRFTDPAAALYVDVQSDSIEGLFAISTSRVPGAPTPPAVAAPSQVHPAGSSGSAQVHVRKRPREDSAAPRHRTTPAKVVERVGPSAHPRRVQAPPPPPSIPSHASQGARLSSLPVRQTPEGPLFLPESQMSAADREALHASGLGDMDADEFNAMMEDDGEEVGLNLDAWGIPPPPSPVPDIDWDERGQGQGQNVDLFEDNIEESEMGPTQSDENGKVMSSLGPLPSLRVRMFRSDRFRGFFL